MAGWRVSLRVRVGVGAALLAWPLAALVSVVAARTARQGLRESVGKSLEGLAAELAARLDARSRDRLDAMLLLATNPVLVGDDPVGRTKVLAATRDRFADVVW